MDGLFCLTDPNKNLPMNRLALTAVFAAGTLAALGAAHAQTSPPARDWRFSVGGGLVVSPEFIGAEDQKAMLFPNFDVRYKDWFFASPRDGIGLQTSTSGLKLSGALGIDLTNRDPKDDPRLTGLRKISAAPALRLKAEYGFGDIDLSALMVNRLGSNAKRGSTVQLEGGYNLLKGQQYRGSVGLSARLTDGKFADNFLSVSPQDSAASGLRPYKAGSGLLDAGVFVQGAYFFNERWSIFSRLQYMQLQGDAADSPIVQKKGQPSFLLFGNYSF
jgi:MipA family protein